MFLFILFAEILGKSLQGANRIMSCKTEIKKCEEILKLEIELIESKKHIKELEEENRILKFDLNEMRNKWFSRRKWKKDEKENCEEEKRQPKKKGAPVGHPGWFRKTPEHIDEIKDIYAKECPNCESLDIKTYANRIEEHIQEDIVIPKVKATKYVHHYAYCNCCHKVFCPKGDDELLKAYIGPTAKSFAVFLKYDIKVSDRDIQKMFERMFGLRVVPSSIPGFRYQLRRAGFPLYGELSFWKRY